jgi:hypothetical protein
MLVKNGRNFQCLNFRPSWLRDSKFRPKGTQNSELFVFAVIFFFGTKKGRKRGKKRTTPTQTVINLASKIKTKTTRKTI